MGVRENDGVGGGVREADGDGDGDWATDGEPEGEAVGDADGVGQFWPCEIESSPMGPSSMLPMLTLKARHAMLRFQAKPSAAGRAEKGWTEISRWGRASVGPSGELKVVTATPGMVAPNNSCGSDGPYRAARMVPTFS